MSFMRAAVRCSKRSKKRSNHIFESSARSELWGHEEHVRISCRRRRCRFRALLDIPSGLGRATWKAVLAVSPPLDSERYRFFVWYWVIRGAIERKRTDEPVNHYAKTLRFPGATPADFNFTGLYPPFEKQLGSRLRSAGLMDAAHRFVPAAQKTTESA